MGEASAGFANSYGVNTPTTVEGLQVTSHKVTEHEVAGRPTPGAHPWVEWLQPISESRTVPRAGNGQARKQITWP